MTSEIGQSLGSRARDLLGQRDICECRAAETLEVAEALWAVGERDLAAALLERLTYERLSVPVDGDALRFRLAPLMARCVEDGLVACPDGSVSEEIALWRAVAAGDASLVATRACMLSRRKDGAIHSTFWLDVAAHMGDAAAASATMDRFALLEDAFRELGEHARAKEAWRARLRLRAVAGSAGQNRPSSEEE